MTKRALLAGVFLVLVNGCGDDDDSSSQSVVDGFVIGEVVRTDESRFANINDYPFEPNHVQAGAVRIHYVDEGPSDAEPVVMLHGEPSWSFLYRDMIPIVVGAGYRVIAPDLVGFGKSDKPVAREDYTYERHVEWMRFLLEEELDLRDVTMFVQDWGGLIGLRLVAADPDRYARVVVGNTGLPEGQGATSAFLAFRDLVANSTVLDISLFLQGGTLRTLDADEIAAYEAPFPDERHQGGALSFPLLVPVEPDQAGVEENRAAWAVLEQYDKPFLTTFSTGDPITAGGDILFQARVPGTEGQPHRRVSGGHFLQEDSPVELANAIVELIRANPIE